MTPAGLDPAAPAVPRPRDGWVDVARGLAIGLVVAGHVAGGVATAGLAGSDADAVWTWRARVYAFHMPAFFVLAGLFAEQSLAKGAGLFLRDKVRTLAYPFVVWGVILTAASAASAGYANGTAPVSRVWLMFVVPGYGPWFLYTLFLISAGFAGAFAVPAPAPVKRAGWLAVAAGLYYAAAPAAGRLADPAALVAQYAVWFAAGVALAGPARRAVGRLPAVAGAGLAVAAGAVLVGAVPTAARPEWPTDPAGAAGLAAVGIVGLFGLAGAVARTPAGPAAGFVGRRSLEVYLDHPLAVPVRAVLAKGFGVTDPGPQIAVGVAAGVGLPLVLAAAADRVGFDYLFTLGRRGSPPARPTAPPVPA